MCSLEVFFCLTILLGFGAIAKEELIKKEYFSSNSRLEELFDTETYLLDHLQSYVVSVESRLNMLRSEIAKIEREHAAASNGTESYLTSPVNAYLLIKRLVTDWTIYEESIGNKEAHNSFLEALAFSRANLSFPTETDATESAVAMARLQDTYQLDTSQFASGIFNGIQYGSSMSWKDCLHLGHQLYMLRDFNHAKLWLKESLERLLCVNDFSTSYTMDFVENIAHYHKEMGDFETALSLANKVLQWDSTRGETAELKKQLEGMVALGDCGLQDQIIHANGTRPYSQTEEFMIYQRMCRGEIEEQPSEGNRLRCRFLHRNVPYRLLMPFKMEEINNDPQVIVFHDVLSEAEIRIIKEISKPKMRRSEVQADEASSEVSSYRTSQNAWLEYDTHPVSAIVRQRLHDITGLDMGLNERLQVANYGIGGHSEPHYDFFEADMTFLPNRGNRMATALFYLSDVEQGGDTAFLLLKKAVRPKKGSLLFFYNLHRSVEGDFRTKHAACPVLKGSKWVAVVWIRARGQEFCRPCALLPDHEVSLEYMDVK